MSLEILLLLSLVLILAVGGFFYLSKKGKSASSSPTESIENKTRLAAPDFSKTEEPPQQVPVELKKQEPGGSIQETPNVLSAPEPQSTQEKEREANFESAFLNTKKGFWEKIQGVIRGEESQVDWDSIEEALYTSDLGPKTVQHLMGCLEESLSRSEKKDEALVRKSIKEEMRNILLEAQKEEGEQMAGLEYDLLDEADQTIRPVVWMIIGVNGSGKTTSIGKLAKLLSDQGKTVMLAAGDTFRAAADAQLKEWSKRAGVELFSPEHVKDPSAVAFDACKSAVAKGYDHVIVDTAGRLHTQGNLMEELKKMKRVIDKAVPGAPHETILVIDGNNGQNALIQAKEFHNALELTGVILTKMDGSSKGGVVVGVAHELGVPIKRIGIGEKIEDLKTFEVEPFVDAIL